MWNITFHSLLVLHWWPYATLAVLVCVCEELKCLAMSWALAKVCPEDCGRWPTLPDTFSLSLPLRTTHLQMDSLFVITSSQRNIIEGSCVGTCLKLHMLLTQCVYACVCVCSPAGNGRLFPLLCHSGWSSQWTIFIENYFLLQTISRKILGDNDT